MKKYLLTLIIALIIGFFLSNFFLRQYNDYEGIKVSSKGETLYFIQYGVFSTLDSLEESTISLPNYIYNKQDGLYYVYVGITSLKENADKIVNYYKNIGNETIIKEYSITNKEFLNLLENYDTLLKNLNDETAISSIINEILVKYEEVVISGG